MTSELIFDPLLPAWLMIIIGIAGLVGAFFSARISWLAGLFRLLAVGAVLLALANPQRLEEERQPLDNTVLVITDESDSMSLTGRDAIAEAAEERLRTRLAAEPNMKISRLSVRSDADGTPLMSRIIEAQGAVPLDRLAGIVLISDGQIHDMSDNIDGIVPEDVPVHLLLTGDPALRDRRIEPLIAPKFGVVGERVTYQVIVEDPGAEGQSVRVTLRVDGEPEAIYDAIVGEPLDVTLEVGKRGQNVIEIEAEPVEGELTLSNNIFVSSLSGIRDRLRVLLVTGEPHSGGRAWRNLLKSDPSVDLVQFTILRPPFKNVWAGPNEMSLIQFPTQELFEDKLNEFDLIIFDSFERRGILQPVYIYNIARYVEEGGAVLVAADASFVESSSLYRSSLASVLPVQPGDDILDQPYRAALTELGERHPITAGFSEQSESWGRWFSLAVAERISGETLMQGPNGEPLLVVDNVEEGRVAILLSDQAWLWAKNYDGGGPYNEIFRRLAHWLMEEPDLEAESLSVERNGDQLTITRQTLEDEVGEVIIERPDGSRARVELSEVAPGRYAANVEATTPGAYRLRSDGLLSLAAIGTLNPVEFSDLQPTSRIIDPLLRASGGGAYALPDASSDLPDIRITRPGQTASDDDWMGLVDRGRYAVTQSRRSPLIPALWLFLIAALATGAAWWREGR